MKQRSKRCTNPSNYTVDLHDEWITLTKNSFFGFPCKWGNVARLERPISSQSRTYSTRGGGVNDEWIRFTHEEWVES